ncbi:MAG TPA: 2,3,4,5-tetrahydropyridine-2,6-dicarboxylate N-succinyltransferase, partial [Gammaproteobacteria bacterium]|nr:2,3,4,5-tetrahydropyridine-2,6-dicarboxylate N-succinyltransferase [Gammaproteobacteria bacterium]
MKEIIESAFEDRAHLTPESANSEIKEAVAETINLLDLGKARVAEQNSIGNWQVNEWLKKAVLLSFRLDDNEPMAGGYTQYFDK